MKTSSLTVGSDKKETEITKSCYENIGLRTLGNMVFQIFLIREFESKLLKLATEGCIHGPVHASIGEEACAVGVMAALIPADGIVSTHRAHHHYLAKAIGSFCAKGFDAIAQGVPTEMVEQVTSLMGEVMGLKIGCCGGRGGSMHLRDSRIGVVGTSAIVAGGVPLASGVAFASKYNRSENVTVCFLGDGAVNQGAFHEAINLAGIWKLPIIYFIENNQYAVATSMVNSTASECLAIKAKAYGISAKSVDGMDPVAVMCSVQEAVEYARGGKGPVLIEAECYRLRHHAGAALGRTFGYRTKEEEKRWEKKDPHSVFPDQLVSEGILSQEQIEQLKSKAFDTVKAAVEYCTVVRDGKILVDDSLWPKLETVETGLKSDGYEFSKTVFSEVEEFTELEPVKYVNAIAWVTGRNIEKDKSVFVLGLEVGNFGGGAFGATKGLPAKYPHRIFNTPISECGFTGLAGGAAMSGLKPIVEIMYPDFALVAADQLFNHIGKLRYMYGNSVKMPIVVRTRIGIGCGYGGQHSMDPVGIFSLFSGWRIVAPSNAFDYIGLFNSAIQCEDPVLIIEHHGLYQREFLVPKNNMDYFVPLDRAKCIRIGNDVTLLSYCSTVELAKQAAQHLETEGISVEVIDLRTLSPADIDYETIGNSLKKTGVLVTIEQASASMSIGSNIAFQCQSRFFDYLDAPMTSVSSLDIPNPVSKRLETATVPDVEMLKKNIRKAIKREL